MNSKLIIKKLIEIDSILDTLEGTDGFFTGVSISDNKIEKLLQEMNVITTNIKGVSSPSDNYKIFRNFIINLTCED